jgi:AhpD family alkylhydroperoxidase
LRLPYTKLAPDAYAALGQVGHYLKTATSLEPTLLEFVYLRASQLNGCHFCTGLHTSELRKRHEPDSRIESVSRWHDSDAFTPRERAAFAWTEAITNLQQSRASDADYNAVTEFFHEKELVDLTFAIATINAWNRISEAFKVEWNPPKAKAAATQS